MSEITSGLHRGIYHQGKLRVNRYNPFEAYVGSESIGDEIIIYGRSNMNRAFDGDIVAVELLPQDQWQGEKSLSIAGEGMLPKLSVCQKADLQLVKIYSFKVVSKLINQFYLERKPHKHMLSKCRVSTFVHNFIIKWKILNKCPN
jgi:exoribonuclease R